jgi:hypothetical protein
MKTVVTSGIWCWWICTSLSAVWAVETVYIEHNSEKQFKEGEPNQVLISSEGEISLGFRAERLLDDNDDVWVVNALVQDKDGDLYLASSGEGYIYRLSPDQEPEIIYGKGEDDQKHVFSLALDTQGRLLAGTGGQAGSLLRFDKSDRAEVLYSEDELKYIWSIMVGPAGRIYLGTGPTGKVITLDAQGKNAEVLYQAKEKNILSLALDDAGILYAGGDEKGLIYRIDPGSKQATIVYDTQHSEISVLVFDEQGNLYAATADASAARPGKQLILSDGETSRPAPEEKEEEKESQTPDENDDAEAKEQADEKSDLDDDAGDEPKEKTDNQKFRQDDNLTEKVAKETIGQQSRGNQKALNHDNNGENEKIPAKKEKSAIPVKESADKKNSSEQSTAKTDKLIPPATTAAVPGAGSAGGSGTTSRPRQTPPPPAKSNDVYKITPQGYVTKIFSKTVVILAMVYEGEGRLLLGTGNDGQLLRLDVVRQEAVILHEVRPSVQISALWVTDQDKIFAGCANPGGVVALERRYVNEGYYVSEVIDAGQITHWGKLQIEAEIPDEATLSISTRSGNTADPDHGGWREWTTPSTVKMDLPIQSEPGRFLQYRLILGSADGASTSKVREVKLAHMIPNLPPQLNNVQVKRAGPSGKPTGTAGEPQNLSKTFTVSWKATDDNKDKLTYKVFTRPMVGKSWIKIAEDLTATQHNWNSLTVADGRYEFKVEVSDAVANAQGTELTDSRISQPVVVDNTPPEVVELSYQIDGRMVRVAAQLEDELSVIKSVSYSLDSAEKWEVALAADGIYDSRQEKVGFEIEVEEAGAHLLTVHFEDALGNSVYRNLNIEISE